MQQSRARTNLCWAWCLLTCGTLALGQAMAAQSASGPQRTLTKIADSAGRVAWYKGGKHELLAFDSITNQRSKSTDLFIMSPSGSGKRNLTAGSTVPAGFIGQPAWHPDGEHIVFQAENANSSHRLLNHMAWGINNDLWMIKRDGSGARRIYSSALNHGALHPHFNHAGNKIIFSKRIPTGKTSAVAKALKLGGGGENQWTGWQIAIADFDMSKSGESRVYNFQTIKPNGSGFYETHGFTKSGRIIYAFTPDGSTYVDDVFTCDGKGGNVQRLINSPKTWDEHVHFSPSGRSFAFMSSRAFDSWDSSNSTARNLRTELFLRDKNGSIVQLTDFNKDKGRKERYLISDLDWDASGARLVFQVAPFKGRRPGDPQLWMFRFAESQ